MPHKIIIRSAEAGDVSAIFQILRPFADEGFILPRSEDDIFQHLQEFMVALYDGALAGVAALHIYGDSLAEIRSLVVDPAHQGRRIGHLLTEACEKQAAGLGVTSMFALTYVPYFFSNMGYEQVAKESLPHKIWTVCVHCEKFADCDEIAMQKRLTDTAIEPTPANPIIEVSRD